MQPAESRLFSKTTNFPHRYYPAIASNCHSSTRNACSCHVPRAPLFGSWANGTLAAMSALSLPEIVSDNLLCYLGETDSNQFLHCILESVNKSSLQRTSFLHPNLGSAFFRHCTTPYRRIPASTRRSFSATLRCRKYLE